MKKILFVLFPLISFGQKYRAIYEDGNTRTKHSMGIVNLVFTEKTVIVNYEDNSPLKTFKYPIINKHLNTYIMTRDSQVTDFWILSQKRYKIVRIWSNQKTCRFGRITYIKQF